MTHYELFFLFSAGFRPKDLIRLAMANEGTAYRAYRNYRKAQGRARLLVGLNKYTSIKEQKEMNGL